MTALLELEKVGKRFGGLQALRDLTFTVNEGEILGLIGPNGAGKSTLFNLINGVFAPDTGVCLEGPCPGTRLERLPVVQRGDELVVGAPA